MLDGGDRLPYAGVVPGNAANSGSPGGKDQPSFEEALKKLEAVVEAMESGDLPLEALLARFEEGISLARMCQHQLEAAEVKVQQLERNAAGELALKPWGPGTGATQK
jgi:exodeoxyribonuclease VII small subunit